MKVLVTGCAGFVGSAVARMLIEQGDTAYGIDNLNDAYDVRMKEKRIELLRGLRGFDWQKMDITDRAAVDALFGDHEFDAVINLAARAGVRQSAADPWAYYDTNVIGTINLLEQCRLSGVNRFVLASSSSVYGNLPVPFSEDVKADRPLSPYAASKKAAEDLCHSYHHIDGIKTTALRFFTVYGPAGRPDMVMFRLVRWIAEGDEVVIFGDGLQRRDFTYIDDVAAGVIAALKNMDGFQVINLGSDRPVKLCDVISEIELQIGKTARVSFKDADPLDVRATWADISRARKLLNWEPVTSIEKGIERTVAWYMQNRSWARDVIA